MGKVNGLEVEAPAETDVVPTRLRDPNTTPTSEGWVTVYAKWGLRDSPSLTLCWPFHTDALGPCDFPGQPSTR